MEALLAMLNKRIRKMPGISRGTQVVAHETTTGRDRHRENKRGKEGLSGNKTTEKQTQHRTQSALPERKWKKTQLFLPTRDRPLICTVTGDKEETKSKGREEEEECSHITHVIRKRQ